MIISMYLSIITFTIHFSVAHILQAGIDEYDGKQRETVAPVEAAC